MALPGGSALSCRGIMKTSIYLMTGVAFCFGILVGLLARLPVVAGPGRAASLAQERHARSLLHTGGLTDGYLAESILKDSQLDYIPNNRRKDFGSSVEETVPSISLNSGLILDTHNTGSHNRDQSLGQQSKYDARETVNEITQGKRLEGVSGKGTGTLVGPAQGKQELPQGRNALKSEGWIDNLPPGENGVMADLNVDDQQIRNSPGEVVFSPGSNLNDNEAQLDIGAPSVPKPSNLAEKFNKLSDVIRGIQWSGKLEKMCPGGFSENMMSEWRKQVAEGKVVRLAEGCGRMQNRMLTLQDSSKACARYRPNTDQIQGEIYSYHLARVLGINNVPPTVLAMVKSAEAQWSRVNQEISMSQWADEKLVVLTRWLDDLEAAYIPKELREDTRSLDPTDSDLLNKSLSELCELVQWSDLIVFDYLTANLDRVVNNMFNQQWNSQMMASPAHNLEKDKNSGRLLFLDNESGLLHGYRLLDKYAPYHEVLLGSVCIFRESTVNAVEKLFLDDNIGDELQNSLVRNEIYHEHLPRLGENNVKILNQRLGNVYDKIQRCRMQYDSS